MNELSPAHAEPELYYRLQQLFDHGHLCVGEEEVSSADGESLGRWQETLQSELTRTFGQDVFLALLPNPFDGEAVARLHEGRRAGKTLILAHPYGETPWISTPLGRKGGACPFCLLYWLRQNRPVERFLLRQRHAATLHQGQPKPARQGALDLLSAQLIARLRDEPPDTQAELFAWVADDNTVQWHPFYRRPQCGHCGNPAAMVEQAANPPRLRRESAAAQGAGLRSEDPGKTYQRLSHLVSPLCGPVAYLHPMPGRHGDSRYVYAAGYLNCPRQLTGENDFDKLCAGKGDHSEQARTSALCESIERFSGLYQGDEPRRRSRQADLDEPSYGFDTLQLFSARQRARRRAINQTTRDPRKQIPVGFDRHTRIDWTPAWSLGGGRRVWVPLGYCYAETPLESGLAFGIHNPNGCAAGSHLDEAVLQGLLELIERDAVAIWWYNCLLRPRVDLADFGIPYWSTLMTEYAAQDYDFWVLDLTHDLEIPCFTAIARHRHQGHHAIGFGCHLDHRIAINRAITELNQLFDPGPNRVNPWNQDLLIDGDFLRPDPAQPPRGRADYARPAARSTADALERCMQRLEQQGMEVLVVDKSRPDLTLKVAQVIVPGLRHFWPRFGPGRLYDVPVKLGWRGGVLAEDELNPALLFL
ncbi:TOMM precursor leader peptide-binding protein [Endothiovibrio diazotrophicus]